MKNVILAAAGMLALAGLTIPQPANAAGCLRGAIAGGVVGHYAGHHGLIGAGIGCAYGHHEAVRREQERQDGYAR